MSSAAPAAWVWLSVRHSWSKLSRQYCFFVAAESTALPPAAAAADKWWTHTGQFGEPWHLSMRSWVVWRLGRWLEAAFALMLVPRALLLFVLQILVNNYEVRSSGRCISSDQYLSTVRPFVSLIRPYVCSSAVLFRLDVSDNGRTRRQH